MTMLTAAAVLFTYTLGGVWVIGPFTTLKACQDARAYQLAHGIRDVTECQANVTFTVDPNRAGHAPLTREEYARRIK